MKSIYFIIIFAVINIFLAHIDAKKIGQNKRILHGVNGLIYVSLFSGLFFFYRSISIELLLLITSLLFTRQIFFDGFLSYFRQLSFFYVTPDIKPKSIIDRIEKRIFGLNGRLLFGVYSTILFILIVLQIILY